MDPTFIAILAIVLCLTFILIEMPVGLAVGLAGTIGILLLSGTNTASRTLGSSPFSASAKYALFAVPTYVLLGCLISNAGIGTQIYRVVNKAVHRLPGGLAATAVLATSIFSGISGSSAADVATFGRISVTEMARNGYDRAYAAAVVAAAGTFAVLIPPSITLVLYAIIAQVSVGAMILAGVVPGILSGLILAGYVVGRASFGKNRSQAVGARTLVAAGSVSTAEPVVVPPHVPVGEDETYQGAGKSRTSDLLAIGSAGVLFLTVVGGLYSGVFTATEAGAVGAFVAFLIALFVARGGKISLIGLVRESLTETAEITSMIFLLLVGGSIFSFALALSGMPTEISEWAGGLAVPPLVVIAVILVLLIPLGAFLDGLSVLLLTVPVIAPIATELGFDGIWFGILVLKVVEVGLITPPVGINAFIISGITKTPVERVYRALVPFVLLDLVVTALFFAFPEIVLWLPRVAGQL
ncbi:TRAP transporter large permease [soil metagenome]